MKLRSGDALACLASGRDHDRLLLLTPDGRAFATTAMLGTGAGAGGGAAAAAAAPSPSGASVANVSLHGRRSRHDVINLRFIILMCCLRSFICIRYAHHRIGTARSVPLPVVTSHVPSETGCFSIPARSRPSRDVVHTSFTMHSLITIVAGCARAHHPQRPPPTTPTTTTTTTTCRC